MFSVGPKSSLNANVAPFQPKVTLERLSTPAESPIHLSSPTLVRPTAIRPSSANGNAASHSPQADEQRPQTAPANMGEAPRPHGFPVETKKPPAAYTSWDQFPNYDAKAHTNYESLRYLEKHPDVGMQNMWNNGTVPFFPTGERPPTKAEHAAFRDFAGQVNGHRNDAVRSGLPPTHLHRLDPLRNGEYGAMYGIDATGRPIRQEFKFNQGEAVALDSTAETRMVIHSHPIKPWHGPATIDDLAYRMPSVTDHQAAALDHMKSGADNYLVYGNRVTHFNGKSLEVTELRPSPLNGRLPEVTP
jgi:hypothetical protein